MPRATDADALSGTWITPEMITAYCELHRQGHAHSIECWQENMLVGGIYGIKIGRVFFGESMFSRKKDASKVAMVHLCEAHKLEMIDAQVYSEHLESLGARCIDRYDFIQQLDDYC